MKDYTESLEKQRKDKDEFYRTHTRSPIPQDEREGFEGLDYFPLKEDYRFLAELHEHDEKEEVTVKTTMKNEQDYIVWGEFHLEIDGEEIVLQAYKSEEDDDRFWVPFKDNSNGEETYGAGRYLDVDEKEDGKWIVDLNQAYNPYCAYNEEYECPLIPHHNHLDVRIEAGEKNYK